MYYFVFSVQDSQADLTSAMAAVPVICFGYQVALLQYALMSAKRGYNSINFPRNYLMRHQMGSAALI